jgi:hypothetical protein
MIGLAIRSTSAARSSIDDRNRATSLRIRTYGGSRQGPARDRTSSVPGIRTQARGRTEARQFVSDLIANTRQLCRRINGVQSCRAAIQSTQPSFDDVPASGAMNGGGAYTKHAKLQVGVRHLLRCVGKGTVGRVALDHGDLPIAIADYDRRKRRAHWLPCGSLSKYCDSVGLDRPISSATSIWRSTTTKHFAWHFGVMTIRGYARLVHTYSCIF